MLYSVSDAQRVEIRRQCGYPVYGDSASSMSSLRFFQWYGLLEYRLNNLSTTEGTQLETYLATLTTLEQGIPMAADNLTAASASSYVHNGNEVRDRMALYNMWRRRLCAYLGVPAGPEIAGGSNGISLVV